MKDLATTMREKYDLRSKMILRNRSDAEMLRLEYDLVHIHRMIARHRRNCAHCRPQMSVAKPPTIGYSQLPGGKSFVSYDMAS
jgi:hypothetical protein